MRYHYKIWPQASPHPAFPNERSAWIAILNVRIAHVATHSPPTKQFEAVVDSGSGDTLFHASIGRSIGIKVEKGIAAGMGGIIKSKKTTAYFTTLISMSEPTSSKSEPVSARTSLLLAFLVGADSSSTSS